MARINLLPWREELRKQRQKDFYTLAGGAAFAMLIVVAAVHLYISGMIDNQNSRNEYLRGEIKIVEGMIKEIENLERQKQQLIARMQVIEQLQRNRPEIVHLFDELVKMTPEGLYLTSIGQKGNSLTLKGKAQSNARVSAFMRALESSDWFSSPSLDVIKAQKSGVQRDRDFVLTVEQTNPEQASTKTAK